MPATIRATLSSANPAAAAARPVNAFSSEITTGMSAPPIGSTNRLPSTAAAIRTAMNSACEGSESWLAASTTQPARIPASRMPLTMCWPGKRIGRPEISSWSFAKAMFEPQNETEPTTSREQDRDQDVERDVPAERRAGGGTRPTRSAPPRRRRRRCRARPSAASGSSARAARRPRRPAVPISDPEHDQDPVADHVQRQRDRDRDRHPAGGDQVAAPRGGRVGALADAEDEQREGDDVAGRDEVGARREARRAGSVSRPSDPLRPDAPRRRRSASASASGGTCRASGR